MHLVLELFELVPGLAVLAPSTFLHVLACALVLPVQILISSWVASQRRCLHQVDASRANCKEGEVRMARGTFLILRRFASALYFSKSSHAAMALLSAGFASCATLCSVRDRDN